MSVVAAFAFHDSDPDALADAARPPSVVLNSGEEAGLASLASLAALPAALRNQPLSTHNCCEHARH